MGQIQQIKLGQQLISVKLPADYQQCKTKYPVVYLLDGDTLFPLISNYEAEIILVAVTPLDRLAEYTPWPARSLHPRFPDFGGKGKDYLNDLEQTLIPYVNQHFRVCASPAGNALLGHSLGGLLAVYSLYHTSAFGLVSSISGSFWYEGWTTYVKEHKLHNTAAAVHLFSGDHEGKGAADLKRDAAAATEFTYQSLARQMTAGQVMIQWNQYRHHERIEEKLKLSLEYLIREMKDGNASGI